MELKRIKTLQINSNIFRVTWDKTKFNSSFYYDTRIITIGTKNQDTLQIFNSICHELMEMVAAENYVRHDRNDVRDDFIFVYDHRQHTVMMASFAGLLAQFIK